MLPHPVICLVHSPSCLEGEVVHGGPDWPNEPREPDQEDLEEPRDKDREPADVLDDRTAVLGYLGSSC